jgi:hypothetical protein
MKYKIQFEECHGFRQGEVVDAAFLGGDIPYLLRVGAVTEFQESAQPTEPTKSEKTK